MESGYANLEPFFNFAPGSFLFLVPAITMRSFAEEKNSGTLELLATRPVTDLQIIGGKFLAAFVLVLFSVLPSIIYYFAIRELASPKGNGTQEVSSVRISDSPAGRMFQPSASLHRP